MDELAGLAQKLKAEEEVFVDYLAGLESTDWDANVYTEGTAWTVRNVLAHLMSAERAFCKLFEQIAGGGSGVSADFDIDRYNASQQRRTKDLTPFELVADFREARHQMIGLVRSLSQADLDIRGRHPFLGITTLREMIRMIYIHNKAHLRDIRRSLTKD
jgi:uncharacterized protein (TIGR03083 family)